MRRSAKPLFLLGFIEGEVIPKRSKYAIYDRVYSSLVSNWYQGWAVDNMFASRQCTDSESSAMLAAIRNHSLRRGAS
jgi:hypothetical protein